MKIKGKDRIKTIIAGVVAVISLFILFSAILWRFLRKELETIHQPVISQEEKEERVEESNIDLYHKNIDPNVTVTPEGKKHYRNEEYGFEFDFPADWKIRQPAFGSAVSLFNLEIIPLVQAFPNPIRVNVVTNDWMDRVYKNDELVGVVHLRTEINGAEADKKELLSDGLPQTDYMFSRGDYWVLVGGKERYKDTFNEVLSSFRFIDN